MNTKIQKSKYSLVIWIAVVFVLHAISRVAVGLYVSDIKITEGLSFDAQNEALVNDLMIVIISKYFVPVLVSVYALFVGLLVVLNKHYPPRYMPIPTVMRDQSGNLAVRSGLIIFFISLLFLGVEVFLINKELLVYLELSK